MPSQNRSLITWPMLLLAWALLLLKAGDASASGYSLSGVGSKATSMGGAFRGLADDYSAAYWNPAGLAMQQGSELSLTGIGIEAQPVVSPRLDIPGYTDQPREGLHDPVLIPNAALFLGIGRGPWLKMGVAGYVSSGLRNRFDLYDLPPGFGNLALFPRDEWRSELEVFDIHPTLALRLVDGRFTMGAGASLQYARATFQYPSLQPLPSSVKTHLGEIPHAQHLTPTDLLMEGEGWGYGANAGILLKPLSILRIGFSGRTETRIPLEGEAVLSMYTADNAPLANTLASAASPEIQRLSVLFSGKVIQSQGPGSMELVIPADMGIGLALQPFKWLTLTGDTTWTGWSAFDELRIELKGVQLLGQPITERTLAQKWEDVVRFSAGLELRLASWFALRGGYYLDPSPIPDEAQTPLIPDIGDKEAFSAGLGLRIGSLGVDVNYEYVEWPDRTVAAPDVNSDNERHPLPGRYQMGMQSIMSTLTWSF